MNGITFFVPGAPVPQPRPRAAMAHGGKGARVHEVTSIKNAITGQRKEHPIVAFKATCRLAASQAYRGAPLTGPLELVLECVLPRPASIPKREGIGQRWRDKKPDADNIAKSIMDSVRGILWVDDAQVARLVVEKVEAAEGEPPGVNVKVISLSPITLVPVVPKPAGLFKEVAT